MKLLLKRIFKKFGFQLKRFPDSYLARRIKIISNNNIDTIIDVGANTGQYALEMRELGFDNKIISFEPLKSTFEKLRKASIKDDKWKINNYALGSEDIKCIINVANNSASSSILNMLPKHLLSAPESKFIAQEEIEMKRLDTVFNSFCSDNENIMLKIDTQGYEKYVLEGAKNSLKRISIVQLEMAFVPLYKDEMLFMDMLNFLNNVGFEVYSIEDGFSDRQTGQLLQVDVILVNKSIISQEKQKFLF